MAEMTDSRLDADGKMLTLAQACAVTAQIHHRYMYISLQTDTRMLLQSNCTWRYHFQIPHDTGNHSPLLLPIAPACNSNRMVRSRPLPKAKPPTKPRRKQQFVRVRWADDNTVHVSYGHRKRSSQTLIRCCFKLRQRACKCHFSRRHRRQRSEQCHFLHVVSEPAVVELTRSV